MTEAEIRRALARAGAGTTIGIEPVEIARGRVVLAFAAAAHLTQHHGFVHAGVLTTVVDSACGFAAATLMAPGAEVLTVEFKVNFMAPATGERFACTGEVIRAGRTLTVCEGRAVDEATGREVARMQATMMAVAREGKA